MELRFHVRVTTIDGWQEWIDHVFKNDAPFVAILKQVGVAEAIRASPHLGVNRRVEDLHILVQRWCSATHNFLTSWGEFTPTLEDVIILLKLPSFGDSDLSLADVEEHFYDVAKELKAASVSSAKYSQELFQQQRASYADGSSSKKVRGTENLVPNIIRLINALL
ncbi:MAG: hypothetical protein Q8877_02885 [Sweet potato little leaf phytoplasma]|nr:hypothetical protein [Sweet potato little leaf phytoplasma]